MWASPAQNTPLPPTFREDTCGMIIMPCRCRGKEAFCSLRSSNGTQSSLSRSSLQNDQILIVKHFNHRLGSVNWWLPGGGPEEGETFEECTVREIREKTHLEVRIERLLLDTLDPNHAYGYERYITSLRTPVSVEMRPGSEAGSQTHSIHRAGVVFLLGRERLGKRIL